ncbi:MAG: rpsC [Candidatus Magasanikbacteria bacterium]|nr:rpsC [Candidatus Magasanikbacteria bacterium]
MPHKVHPKIFRIGMTRTWDSRWYSRKKEMPKLLAQDFHVREFLTGELKDAGLDSVVIERNQHEVTITLNVAKPGFVIGRGGAGAEELRKKLQKKFFGKGNVKLNIQEVTRPSLSAPIVVQNMITDIEKRMPFRRVMKMGIDRIEKAGAHGVKVRMSGRLNGAEIARTEKLASGKIPLTSLRADIDFAYGIARTIYGTIGIQVWIYRGDIFEEKKKPTVRGAGEQKDKQKVRTES